MFGRDGHPTPLGQAFIEYGRIAKTLHLLALVDPVDGSYQRRMNRQLTVQDPATASAARSATATAARSGRPIAKARKISSPPSAWSSTPSCCGIPVTSTPSWRACAAAASPCATRLSPGCPPLGRAHLNCLGRYAFTTQPPAELRPLRDPNARDGEDDGEF